MSRSRHPSHGFSTRAIHRTLEPRAVESTPIAPPIVQTASFAFDDLDAQERATSGPDAGFAYSRLGNPTVAMLEEAIADLEGADHATAFASGVAAIHAAVLATCKSGDRIVAPSALYGGTYALFTKVFPALGIETTFVDRRDLGAWERAIDAKTKLLWAETIINPTLDVMDLPALGELTHRAGAKLAVDATFTTPFLSRPLEQGVDLVVHSATKYLGGHGDVIAGVVAGRGPVMNEVRRVAVQVGGNLSPFPAFLILRGLKTLSLRMAKHCENALEVAEALERHPKVSRVVYPGLPSHPDHATTLIPRALRGGMVGLEVIGDRTTAEAMVNRLTLFLRAGSLGDAHSLVALPSMTSHRPLPPEVRRRAGIADAYVRLSVGLEDARDLIGDLAQALG